MTWWGSDRQQQWTVTAILFGLLLSRQKSPAELNALINFLLTVCGVVVSFAGQAGNRAAEPAGPDATRSDRVKQQDLQSQLDVLKQSLSKLESRVGTKALSWKLVRRPRRSLSSGQEILRQVLK